MGVYLTLYDAVVTKLTTAHTGGILLGVTKQIFTGNVDRDILGNTPCVIIHAANNQGETWAALPSSRDARLVFEIRCVAKHKEISGLDNERSAIRLMELVTRVLLTDLDLSGAAEIINTTIQTIENVGDETYHVVMNFDTQKRFIATVDL